MHIDFDQSLIVIKVPAILRNKHNINVNKAQIPYQFAVGENSKNYLKLMIQDRIDRGEPLNPDSWVFKSYVPYTKFLSEIFYFLNDILCTPESMFRTKNFWLCTEYTSKWTASTRYH